MQISADRGWWTGWAMAALALAANLPAGPVVAQELRVEGPDARYPDSFGLVGGIVELSTGAVLVADPLGEVLVRITPDLTRADTLGRVGQGPDEYRQPDAVWPLAADSALLVDLGNARLTVIDPDGRLGETLPIVQGPVGPGMSMAIPGGTDRTGGVYYVGSAIGRNGLRDSIEVFRLDRSTGQSEAVATVKTREMARQESGGPNNRSVSVRPIPLSAEDAWGAGPDGTLFLARSGDYHVETRTADGRIRRGGPVDYDPVSIGSAEREEWSAEIARGGGVSVSVEQENGQARVSMGRSTRGFGGDDLEWPDTKPPFYASRIRVDSEGRGWVRRHVQAGEPALYDLFDATGVHQGSVRLPPDRRLAGFGDGTVYLVYVDPVDLQSLERYPLP